MPTRYLCTILERELRGRVGNGERRDAEQAAHSPSVGIMMSRRRRARRLVWPRPGPVIQGFCETALRRVGRAKRLSRRDGANVGESRYVALEHWRVFHAPGNAVLWKTPSGVDTLECAGCQKNDSYS